nr:MAG TPA: hypothetical protein [Caudoviricetes sp.]
MRLKTKRTQRVNRYTTRSERPASTVFALQLEWPPNMSVRRAVRIEI